METKNKIILLFVLFGCLSLGGMFAVRHYAIRSGYDEGYVDGVKRGAYSGFEMGLEEGRKCGLSECDGKVQMLFQLP